tara:strand:+ start:2109 stop:2624 length:516 start_codon:yes stop_codon:yes gene_type:complete
MTFKLIVAISKNYGIGINNTLPWNISEDLKHFSKTTKGNGNNAIVMGKNTWNSLNGRYLKKRDNLILSTSLNIDNNSNSEIIKSFPSIDNILDFINKKKYDDVWIIGGGTIYKTFIELNLITECYITFIDKLYECDSFFPMNLLEKWNCDKPIMINTNNNFNVYIKRFYKS